MKPRLIFFLLLLSILCLSVSAAPASELIIPEDTTVINDEAFFGDTSLDVVVLPDGIERIGERAFASSSLKTIHLPASLQYVAENAFEDTDAELIWEGIGQVTVWVAGSVADFTREQVESFLAENPSYQDMTVTVESMGEEEAAVSIIADLSSSPDLYGFAQDQLVRLVSSGALSPAPSKERETITAENTAGSVAAATVGNTVYAYPMTADNGYFMYYDKSVVSDPSDLSAIVSDCEKAGKYFCMQLSSGWYQTAFFFGAGAELNYSVDEEGSFSAVNCTYASNAGVRALKSMISLAKSPAFRNISSADDASDIGAIVTGTWDANILMEKLGENYAAAKLPTADGYQLSGFGGYKLMGVLPQTGAGRHAACHALAAFLTSPDVQLARYEAVSWGPSSLSAQQHPALQADPALAALAAQLQYSLPQGQYPGAYWGLAGSLGGRVISGELNDADDATLLKVLTDFAADAASYVN